MKKMSGRHPMTPRRTVILLGIGIAVSLLGDSTLYTVLPIPHFAAQVGVTMTMVGILLGTNRAIRLLTNGPVGIIYGRIPRRPLLVASLCLGSLSSLVYTVGFGFWPLFFGRILWGIAWSFLWIGSRTMILEISDENNRGYLNGLFQMCFLAGVGFSSLFGGVISDQFGFHYGQRLCAGIIFLAAIVWFVFLPETLVKKKKAQKIPPIKLKKQLRWKIIVPSMIIIFITYFIEWGVLAVTASLWINNLFGEEPRILGYLVPAATLAGSFNAIKFIPGIGSAPLIGLISDRLRRRWIVILIALIASGLGLWLMSVDVIYLALFGALLASVFGGSAETLIPAIIGDETGGKASGRSLGMIYLAADLGATIGPIVSLAIIDSSYLSVGELYRACIALLIFAVIITSIASKSEGRRELKH
jgi:MFS family permease